jgi:hypothetical protein
MSKSNPASRPKPTPKRTPTSREPYKPPRDRKELLIAIGAGAAVVLVSIGVVLFLGRDDLGSGSSTPTPPVATTPSTPAASTPAASTPAASTPAASIPPASSETPLPAGTTASTLPGAPAP